MEESLYDTSRLIDAYKKKEIIQGYTTIFNIIEFPKAMEFNLQILFPEENTLEALEKDSVDCKGVGLKKTNRR